MRFRRYTEGFNRRALLQGVAGVGLLRLGVLAPLWRTQEAHGEAHSAYPHEFRSLEDYTQGAISTGDVIDKNNVDHVKPLLDSIRYEQIKHLGRRLRTRPATTQLTELMPWEYLQATLSHQGQARFDAAGNVRHADGGPWIGGHPFPDPANALEIFAGHTLSWGRHDVSLYASKEYDVDASGSVKYRYESVWAEYAPVGRLVLDPKPHDPKRLDQLRYQSVIFMSPHEYRGTSFLNIWPYDQRQFPELKGYLPAFKRIRRYPTNQRFEPLIPGSSLYLSDAWAAGDPFLTWGNYKVVHRGPALAALSGNWAEQHPNWEHTTHGGAEDSTWWDMTVELIPEAIVVEAQPVSFPRAPILKKQVWFDARTLLPFVMVSFDRRGQIFRSFDGAFSQYKTDTRSVIDGTHPYWSWTHLHAHNIQTGEVTRIEQVANIRGGHQMRVNDERVFDRYLTTTALRRFGI